MKPLRTMFTCISVLHHFGSGAGGLVVGFRACEWEMTHQVTQISWVLNDYLALSGVDGPRLILATQYFFWKLFQLHRSVGSNATLLHLTTPKSKQKMRIGQWQSLFMCYKQNNPLRRPCPTTWNLRIYYLPWQIKAADAIKVTNQMTLN